MFLPAAGTAVSNYSSNPVPTGGALAPLSDVQYGHLPSGIGQDVSSQSLPGNITVMVGLKLSDQAGLNALLKGLQDPQSPNYHQYLTRKQFTDRFSIPLGTYDNALSYFKSYSGVAVNGYSDRMAISLSGNARDISGAFNSGVGTFTANGSQYYQFMKPSLPSWLMNDISYVSGLQNYSGASYIGGGAEGASSALGSTTFADGYPLPFGTQASQLLWGPDLQKAYNVTGILNSTSLNGTVIADIFWTSTGYAPYNPVDINTYLNETLPPWEQRPSINGIPLNSALPPGPSSQNGSVSITLENTLDLEMLGSLSPGASIFDVYTTGNAYALLDNCMAYILNPGNVDSPLNNVSVVSNSWYGTDAEHPIWNHYMEEAAARGITVVACSGDSGNDASSSKYFGSSASFPGTDSSNSSGVLSVGGTDITLNANPGSSGFLSITNTEAWYLPPNTENNPTPVGTEGGISQVYPEPSWQVHSVANIVLGGKGRGVPDVSAVGNNMVIFITLGGVSYYDSPQYYYSWGTSVAAPVVSGIIADIDANLALHNMSSVGFADPLLYNLSNIQYSYDGVSSGHFQGFSNPFRDVPEGSNYMYKAKAGYDLLTGLGQINAGNLSHDILGNYSFAYYPHNSTRGSPLAGLLLYRALPITAGAMVVLLLAKAGIFRRRKQK